MIKLEAPRLKILASTSSKDAARSLRILQQFVNSVPVIVEEFAERAYLTAVEIAPFGSNTAEDQYGNFYTMGSRKTPLKQTIVYNMDSPYGFSLETDSMNRDSNIKSVMQEYGYPYDTAWGPYPPNPKNSKRYRGTPTGKVKGLGYLRIGLIYASSSLNKDKVDYFKTYSPADVQNYNAIVEKNLKRVLTILSTGFATGKTQSLPRWYTQKVKLPTETISKFTSKFGAFDTSFTVPVSTNLWNMVIDSQLLSRAQTSFTGRPFAPRRRFLLDL